MENYFHQTTETATCLCIGVKLFDSPLAFEVLTVFLRPQCWFYMFNKMIVLLSLAQGTKLSKGDGVMIFERVKVSE